VNVIRVATLSVLLAASVAWAQAKKPPQPKAPEKPMFTEQDKPKTCSDQCDLMEKFLTEPCKKGAGDNKAAQKDCETNVKQMVNACNGSCKDKGRLDKQYMMERMKPPPGTPLPQGGQQGGGEGMEDVQ
jgi:hypothetical protein